MKVKIGNNEHELIFGVRFVRELDKVAGMEVSGVELGFGLTKTLPAIQEYDPAVLSDIIYSATYKCSPRPSHDDVDDAIDEMEEKELTKLFKDVLSEIKKTNAIKVALKNMGA